MKKLLNVGGATHATPMPAMYLYQGWQEVRLDIDPSVQPDIVGDARQLLQGEANAYDAIYCSHNLEHYYRHDAIKVLQGFAHVLKDNGFVHLRVPDLGGLMRLVVQKNLDMEECALHVEHGASSGPGCDLWFGKPNRAERIGLLRPQDGVHAEIIDGALASVRVSLRAGGRRRAGSEDLRLQDQRRGPGGRSGPAYARAFLVPLSGRNLGPNLEYPRVTAARCPWTTFLRRTRLLPRETSLLLWDSGNPDLEPNPRLRAGACEADRSASSGSPASMCFCTGPGFSLRSSPGSPVPRARSPWFTIRPRSPFYKVLRDDLPAGSGTCWLDSCAELPAISFTPKDGSDAGKPRQGIYRLEDKTLTICLAYPDQPRPTDFLALTDVQQLRVYRKA